LDIAGVAVVARIAIALGSQTALYASSRRTVVRETIKGHLDLLHMGTIDIISDGKSCEMNEKKRKDEELHVLREGGREGGRGRWNDARRAERLSVREEDRSKRKTRE
jgi:hypothetical protein